MTKASDITVVTGTIGDDIHSLGITVIEHALRNVGFHVVKLGIQVSQEDYIKAAIETDAKAILVSSMSGHGRVLCQGFRDKCIEAGIPDVLLYVGGCLTTGDTPWDEIERYFLEDLKFNQVMPNTSLPGDVIEHLKDDLEVELNA
ncbi:MAG: methylaspartate mutase subunit S [Solobacterium sp.]|nr:methylaspartate mutase subunit S [Lachnospiraceae bacterium]MBR4162599.1 methylaspartate mutase subunit S [Solobacterium sp.]